MRRAARRDSTHAEILAALRAVGCSVLDLAAVGGGCPDALVGYRGRSVLLEIKTPGRERHDKAHAEKQAAWHAAWRGEPVRVVTSPDEALRAVVQRG